ncbi:MAG: BrnA antitoxin family protein [Deltaproteobacteria bacterium]|nr:BrnA antitoxin family protein [Deltaproteobacteria bacterium]
MRKRNLKKESKTDWARVDAMEDRDIDFSDTPELDADFFSRAVLRLPEPKAVVTMRLDREVLEWFKAQGRGYQTRINSLLKAYMEAHKGKHEEKEHEAH